MLTHAYTHLKTDIQQHYVTEGEGPLMLFLHGNPCAGYMSYLPDKLIVYLFRYLEL
jgi:hypothetical protein